jgi:hypothetical protein
MITSSTSASHPSLHAAPLLVTLGSRHQARPLDLRLRRLGCGGRLASCCDSCCCHECTCNCSCNSPGCRHRLRARVCNRGDVWPSSSSPPPPSPPQAPAAGQRGVSKPLAGESAAPRQLEPAPGYRNCSHACILALPHLSCAPT